mmetsp:Transcript_13677/g.15342  ORF Transcript_13677/g.15342 Transcript_13677/m.15342 type:complete len:145 (+) Transcript_13677:40-474(+)
MKFAIFVLIAIFCLSVVQVLADEAKEDLSSPHKGKHLSKDHYKDKYYNKTSPPSGNNRRNLKPSSTEWVIQAAQAARNPNPVQPIKKGMTQEELNEVLSKQRIALKEKTKNQTTSERTKEAKFDPENQQSIQDLPMFQIPPKNP